MNLSVIEQFEDIMSCQSTRELVPFLLSLAKKDVPLVRTKTLEFLKSGIPNARPRQLSGWTIYPPLSAIVAEVPVGATFPTHQATPFHPDLDKEESALFFLTALATYTRKDAFGNGFNWWGSLAHDFFRSRREEIRVVLQHSQPVWLSDWLMGGKGNSLADYWLLRELEDAGFIEYRPQHFAFLFSWLTLYADPNQLVKKLIEDEKALARDLPLQFEYDVSFARHDGKSAANYQKFTWQRILVDLTNSGNLDRADILTRCLLALRRDFRRPLLTWFKELFLSLKPTPAERLARQTELTELLAHPLPLVVNFALDQLKDLWTEPTFRLDALLLYAEGLLTRQGLNTGIKTLLSGFGKLLKQHPAQAPALACLYAAALAHADGAVQERAARGLADLLQTKKPLLTPVETAATTDRLRRYAELLGPAARALVAPWLAAAEETTAAAEPADTYTPLADFQPEISPAMAIAPVADWHELLFLTGQVLKHDDPLALERWVDGLLRLQGHWPAGYAEQLGSYLAQVLPQLKKAAAAEQLALLTGPVTIYGHAGLAVALLLSWATGFATPRVGEVRLASPHLACPPLLGIEQARYGLAEARLRAEPGTALPLLSTPTHRPYWIAPSALVNKLLAYQKAGLAPASADLAVALARTAHAHPAETAEALRRLPELAHPALRALLTWLFGPVGQPLPALGGAAGGRAGAGLQAPVAEALPELWAVAARTKAPAGIFPTLSAALGYDYAGVTQPLRSTFEAVARENHYPDPAQPAQAGVYRFVELAWSSGAVGTAPSPLLLYAPPVGKSQAGSWEENSLLTSNLLFMAALLPNYAAPVYDQVLRCAAWADNLETTERDVLTEALRALLGPGPAFAAAATAVLASGLIHHTPPCRSLGQEVLLQAIAHGRLLPGELGHILGRQLATGYAPVPRLASSILAIKGLDARTDDALHQTLDALLPELPAAAPRNTAKLLNAYADLVGRTRRPVPPAVQARLRVWQATPALKKGAAVLLAQEKF